MDHAGGNELLRARYREHEVSTVSLRGRPSHVVTTTLILAGGIRSVYSMMETCRGLFRPRNISLAIKEDGDGFRLNGKGVD